MDIEDTNWSGERDGDIFKLPVGGLDLEGCHWRCPGAARFAILFFHGLSSCLSFNANFLREFPAHGLAAFAVDHPGNGYSPGPRASQTVADVCAVAVALIAHVRREYPTTPIVLMGHSMGGLALASLALRDLPALSDVAGVIVHAPWLTTQRARVPGRLQMLLLRIVSAVYPGYRIDTGLRPETAPYPQGYRDTLTSSGLFLPFMTARTAASVMSESEFVKAHAQCDFGKCRVLFMQGARDNCVDVEENVLWAQRLARERPDLTEVCVMEDGDHDLFKGHTRRRAFLMASSSHIATALPRRHRPLDPCAGAQIEDGNWRASE